MALVAQRQHGKSSLEATREAWVVRFRPIMMASLVWILAAPPIAMGLGKGSDLRRSSDIVLIDGLLISQALTLLSTPALNDFSCQFPSACGCCRKRVVNAVLLARSSLP